MFSPRIVFAGLSCFLVVELIVWRVISPVSFNSMFDTVERNDVVIEPAEIELGSLQKGEIRQVIVRVTNNKGRAITLREPAASCGCIHFPMDQAVVLQPKETRELSLDFVAPQFPGLVRQSVQLRVVTASSSWQIPLAGKVTANSCARPQEQVTWAGDSVRGTIYFPAGQRIDHLIVSHPKHIKVTLEEPSHVRQSYEIHVEDVEGGSGYVAFMDPEYRCLATVPVHWKTPNELTSDPHTAPTELASQRKHGESPLPHSSLMTK